MLEAKCLPPPPVVLGDYGCYEYDVWMIRRITLNASSCFLWWNIIHWDRVQFMGTLLEQSVFWIAIILGQDIDVFLSSRQFGTGSGFLGPRGAPVPISNVSAPPGCLPMRGGGGTFCQTHFICVVTRADKIVLPVVSKCFTRTSLTQPETNWLYASRPLYDLSSSPV